MSDTQQTENDENDIRPRGKFRDHDNHASWKEVYAAMDVEIP